VPRDIDRLETGSECSGPHFRQNPEAKGVALRAGVRSLAAFRRAPVPDAGSIRELNMLATTSYQSIRSIRLSRSTGQ
jgi:hypothetical protein